MEEFVVFGKLYLLIAAIMLLPYYFIPAGAMYYLFFIRNREKWDYMRIQDKYPVKKAILYEIKWSVWALLVFTLLSTVMVTIIMNGDTKMYFEIGKFGWPYFVFSIILAFFLHDAYYYWMHRFMHNKKVFRHIHLVHHRSKTPTPFAIYSFQPLEVFLQFMVYPFMLFLIPYHPVAFGIFIAYDLFINVAGHTGFEFLPARFTDHWFFRWQNSVTHHDMHHSHLTSNFGLYFNIWDRLMGTLHKDYQQTFKSVKARENSTQNVSS